VQNYKIILLGDGAVGKTSIRKQYLGEGFEKSYTMTLGADFAIKRVEDTVFQIWDLAGHPFFRNIQDIYFGGAHGVILVFDLTRIASLNNLQAWIDQTIKINEKPLPCVIVGNKFDLFEKESLEAFRPIVNDHLEELSKCIDHEIEYIESSALLGENIDLIFEKLIYQITKDAKDLEE
jgi:small GTP-binding protein